MCSQRLWRLIRTWEFDRPQAQRSLSGCRLGPWAATVSQEDERRPVIAIDVGTYFTVVFPLGDPATFYSGFAEALGFALDDVGVDSDRIAIEAAAVKTLSVRRLQHASLREPLKMVDYMCGLELSYATDLRTVQRRLNDFPHNLAPHYVPDIAVQHLFGLLGSDPLDRRH